MLRDFSQPDFYSIQRIINGKGCGFRRLFRRLFRCMFRIDMLIYISIIRILYYEIKMK